MAGSPTPPVAPSEGRTPSPTTGQVIGGSSPVAQGAREGTLAPAASVTPDGGAPPSPDVGSVEIEGTTQTGYSLAAGAGIALGKSGKAIQISFDPSTLPSADVPIGDIVPGAADTVANTDPTGASARWSKLTDANIATGAAINPLKIAIGAPVAVPVLNVDWSLGSVFTKTLAAGANAITFSNGTSGQTIVLKLVSDAGGSTVSWPVTVKWSGGSAPTQTSPSGTDVYTFVDIDGVFYGSVVQNFS